MNKERLKGLIMGFILCAMLMFGALGVVASTQLTWRNVSVATGYRVIIEGEEFVARDAQGRIIEVINLDGWLFAPFEHIARALGKAAEWDGTTNTLYLGNRFVTQRQPLRTAAPFFDRNPNSNPTGSGGIAFRESVSLSGISHGNALVFRQGSWASARTSFTLHNLGGQYRMLAGHIGRVDGADMYDVTVNFIGDGRLLQSFDLKATDMPTPLNVSVWGVQQLRVEIVFPATRSSVIEYALSAFLE
jgi:hypothetical protein